MDKEQEHEYKNNVTKTLKLQKVKYKYVIANELGFKTHEEKNQQDTA